MRATTWIDWDRVTLEFPASDMERVIVLCGWIVVDTFHHTTEEDRAELARLQTKTGVSATTLGVAESQAWWDARVVKREPFSDLASLPPVASPWYG